MRATFNFYFDPPTDVGMLPKSLPVYPSRLEQKEKLKIEVKSHPIKVDWLKWGVSFLGLITLIAGSLLAINTYQQNKIISDGQSNISSTKQSVVEPKFISKPIVQSQPVAAQSIVTAPVLQSNTSEVVEKKSPAIVSQAESSPKTESTNPPEIIAQKVKTTESKTNVISNTANPQSKMAPLLQSSNQTMESNKSSVVVPKFIIANENNPPMVKQQKSGIFKRPAQQVSSKPDIQQQLGPAKTDASTQKLF